MKQRNFSTMKCFTVLTLVSMFLLVDAALGQDGSTQQEPEKKGDSRDWWVWWGAKNESDFGKLCESDNDVIGKKLGCSCTMMQQDLVADCKKKWLGFNDTIMLPPRLNISRHVRKLDFSNNFLKTIDENTFGDCDGVTEINFSENEIEAFHNLNCSRLTGLNLSWNKLKNLTMDSFKNLQRLVHLQINHNDLLYLDHDVFNQLHQLRSLHMEGNPLGTELYFFKDYLLSIQHMKYLEELNLGNTSLMDFPLALINGTTNLKRLILSNNRISFVPSAAFTQLEKVIELDLSGNLFESILQYSFIDMPSLKILRINRMPQLKSIEAHAFTGLKSLVQLSCSRNHFLDYIDPMAFRNDSMGAECSPKIVKLHDNNLHYIEFGVLDWKNLEQLDLFRNPWVCDCNLQWVSEYAREKMSDASMLIDREFKCYEPSPLKDMPVTSVEPELLMCYSPVATIAGTIGIIIFCVVLVLFLTIIALGRLGILPTWLQKFDIFGSGSLLPKYTRVHPKPSRSRRMEKMSSANYSEDPKTVDPTIPPDLEWDNGDVGNIGTR